MTGGRFCGTTAAFSMLLASLAGPAVAGTLHQVQIDGNRFYPPTLTVRVGDAVVWINKDPFPHTVTAESGEFDSRSIDPGRSWRHVFRKSGDFPYRCTLHTTMRGVLRVEPARRQPMPLDVPTERANPE